jgi:hypothetical protein
LPVAAYYQRFGSFSWLQAGIVFFMALNTLTGARPALDCGALWVDVDTPLLPTCCLALSLAGRMRICLKMVRLLSSTVPESVARASFRQPTCRREAQRPKR